MLCLREEQYVAFLGVPRSGTVPRLWLPLVRVRIHAEILMHAAVLTEAQNETSRSFMYYERMFSHDPCNEKACRWLIVCHLAAGQLSDVVRIYERCQLPLRKVLDIEPEDQTRRLYRSIIGGWFSNRRGRRGKRKTGNSRMVLTGRAMIKTMKSTLSHLYSNIRLKIVGLNLTCLN
jgi:DNA-binding SARP family transcriptional activator